MRYLITLILCLFLFPLALADIGPSPDFSFSIGNSSEYPDYKFYYAGNIWPEKLTLIESDNFVYKLNTNIKVYAVPLEYATDSDLSEAKFSEISSNSVVSQAIDLPSGKTVFEVKSFSKEQGSMVLETKSNVPDAVGFDFASILVPAILVVVVIVLIVFVVKHLKK